MPRPTAYPLWQNSETHAWAAGHFSIQRLGPCMGVTAQSAAAYTDMHSSSRQTQGEDGQANGSVWLITEDGTEPFDWDAVPPWRR